MLDIKVTQGSYWKGAQISYFVYILLTIFGGLFGLDHLALRSPLTALLKFLTIIPLLGFWYFYDIAQALGEREYVEKFGIGVPFYGPTGIGAGIFTGSKEYTPSPKEIPGPWRYLFYVLTTCVFIVFPINKFVLGDYISGILHILFYILFPLTFVAIAWSFYDVFHVLFKTRDIFEHGVPHMIPASMLVGTYFRRDALGPYPPPPPPPPSWFQRLFTAWSEVPISTGKATANVITTAADYATAPAQAAASVVKGVGSAVQGVGEASKAVTSGVANVVVGEVKDVAKEAGDVASEAIDKAKVGADTAIASTVGVVSEGAKAAEGVASLAAKIPAIGEKVASEMSDPSKIIEAAKKSTPQVPEVPAAATQAAQAGGALALASMMEGPSVSTSVLLFSIALVAFSGYVFYTMRNTYKKPEKSDDPPREPATVRGPSKPSE
jgi:hypothetical protein